MSSHHYHGNDPCARCGAKLDQGGEPYHTDDGLYCRACVRATGKECRCRGCKQWRRALGAA